MMTGHDFFNLFIQMCVLSKLSGSATPIDDCPAPAPCRCGNNAIVCSGDSFNTVPAFTKSNEVWQVYLDLNNISTIPSGAFRNIRLGSLNLENNGLTFIASDAFHGSEYTLRSLHLSYNKLESLPEGIGTLRNITYLNIQGNPLTVKALTPEIFVNISDTLDSFHFGSPLMTSWPSVLNLLKIYELGVYDLPLEDLPDNAFSGFQNNLSWLYIDSTKLKRLPTSLNQATGLFFLSLSSNEYLSLQGVSKMSFQGLSKIDWFQIQNEPFESLPDIFKEITGITEFEVMSTPINDFDAELLPKKSNISILTLNDTRISKVPSAISKMKSMHVLALNYNNITAIQDEDFAGLTEMEYVSVSNCPLSNVSRNALKSLTSMKYIAFDFTQLTTIPRAIEEIKFDIISLYENPIVCTCESLGWMKHWPDSQQIGINGQCRNLGDSDLADYVRNEVPKCQG